MTIVSMNYLLEVGAHFGHQKRKWNPKMRKYIFTTREDIHIINLQLTLKGLEEAYEALGKIAEKEGTVLFVGTKKQAQEAVQEAAERVEMFYVRERWLGGTLTNFKTIRSRTKRLDEIEKMEADGVFELLPKKEVLQIRKEYDKLLRNLKGIRKMEKLPKALIIVDPAEERMAIREANKLNIPVFGIVDTNGDPDNIDYVIPANEDSVRSVKLLLGVLANAVAEKTGKEVVNYISDDKNEEFNEEQFKEELLKAPVKEDADKREERFEGRRYNKDFKREERPRRNYSKEETEEFETKKIKVVETKKETDKNEEIPKETPTKKVEEAPKEKVAKKVKSKDFNEYTLDELKKLAKENEIKGYSKLKKDELISLLEKEGTK